MKKNDSKNNSNLKDTMSEAFERNVDAKKRKKHSQFFTHKELVNFIISNVPIKSNSKILDPSCGAGAFLIEAYNRNKNINNLYGIDIDKKPLELCKANLKKSSGKISTNLRNSNTIMKSSLETIFPEISEEGGFDIIIGNPPFQNLKKDIEYNKNESIYKSVLSGVANSSTLMIAKSYDFLKEGGFLGFVLPKNIIRVDSFSKLRKFLAMNTKIIYIYDIDHYFKDVRCDQIIIIFQKKKLSISELKKNKVKILIQRKNQDFDKPYSYEISQSYLLRYDFYPIFYHKDIFSLANKFLSMPLKLERVVNSNIFRGIGLSSKSKIIYKNNNVNLLPILRGDSISRFGIKYKLFIDNEKLDNAQKNKAKKLKTKKIVLQNLFSKEGGLFSTISNSKELSLDTVTNIISEDVSNEYLVGILNSRISNFFFIFVIFLNSNFTMHMDKKYVGQLPIVIPEKNEEKEVVKMVRTLLNIDDKYSRESFEKYNLLNEKLYKIYGLKNDEIRTIERLLREVMSVKQNGRKNE
jgi:tRNA1(Val) A37 N6-methylase TrmN6